MEPSSATAGSLVTGSGTAIIAQNAGSQGSVTIDGIGSQLSSTSLTVGELGSGALNLTGGGKAVASADVLIGNNQGSSGTVTINGASQLTTNNHQAFFGVGGSSRPGLGVERRLIGWTGCFDGDRN